MSSESVFRKAMVTRLCHDFAGGVSAVSNCLSLMSELESSDKETIELAEQSAQILFSRLRFFRAVFGNDGALPDMESTKKILESYLKTLENKRISYVCQWDVEPQLPLFIFRLILLSSLVAVDCLSMGGAFSVSSKAGEEKIVLEIQTQGNNATPESLQILQTQDEGSLSAKNVHVFFLLNCLNELDWSVLVQEENEKIVLVLQKNHK